MTTLQRKGKIVYTEFRRMPKDPKCEFCKSDVKYTATRYGVYREYKCDECKAILWELIKDEKNPLVPTR